MIPNDLIVKMAGVFLGVLARTLVPWVRLFCLAFGFGFGWNAVVFEAGKWAGAFEDESLSKIGNNSR